MGVPSTTNVGTLPLGLSFKNSGFFWSPARRARRIVSCGTDSPASAQVTGVALDFEIQEPAELTAALQTTGVWIRICARPRHQAFVIAGLFRHGSAEFGCARRVRDALEDTSCP